MNFSDPPAHAVAFLRDLELNPDRSTRWLRVGALFDADGAGIKHGAHLVFDRFLIHHADTEAPPSGLVRGIECVDLPETTILPGIFDAHTHISMGGAELNPSRRAEAQRSRPEALLTQAEARARYLASMGISGMRDGGDKDGVGLTLSMHSRVEGAESAGTLPRIFSPGPGIHRAGRYGSFFSRPAEDHASIGECVRQRVAEGADHVKLVPTGIINFKKGIVSAKPQFSAGEVAQASRCAVELNRHLMAHASGVDGIQNAIEGGVDTIEHGYFISSSQLAYMRDHGITWVPTFAPVWRQLEHADEMGWDQTVRDHLRRILDGHAASLQTALEIGVRVLIGSDAGSCGVAHGVGLLDEMRLIEKAGMSTEQVLSLVCGGNSKALFPEVARPVLKNAHPAVFFLAPSDVTRRSAALGKALVYFRGQATGLWRLQDQFDL
ncbi:MAG: amidohydrolase family protein [Oceanipulchritudo sp.]